MIDARRGRGTARGLAPLAVLVEEDDVFHLWGCVRNLILLICVQFLAAYIHLKPPASDGM
jgi:hypothetical protein